MNPLEIHPPSSRFPYSDDVGEPETSTGFLLLERRIPLPPTVPLGEEGKGRFPNSSMTFVPLCYLVRDIHPVKEERGN